MDNSIATRENTIMVAGAVKAKAPILQFVNKELSGEFKNGDGSTVDALVPSYGVVTEGEAIGDTSVSIESVPVTVTVANTAAALGIVQRSLDIDNFDAQVAKPRGAKLAAYVNEKIFKAGFNAAEYAVASVGTFAQLGTAIAHVEGSRIDGMKAGMLNPQFKAIVTNTGINQFGNSSLAKDLYDGVIGEFNGAEFIASPDAKVITTSWVPTSGSTVSTTVSANDAYQITIADAGLTSANTVKAGTAFQVAGVYAVDAFGDSTGVLRSFIVIEDATAGSGSVQVKVAPLYFSGAKKNCSANLTANAAVTTPLVANSVYYTGIVFNENAITFASAAIKPFAGCDSTTTKIEGEINVRMSAQADVNSGAETVRWDILAGAKAVHGKAIAAMYVRA